MQAGEFWCRAFLASMGGTYAQGGVCQDHEQAASYHESAADAALDVARRRGMVAGERTASAPGCRRVEFAAERGDHGLWNLSGPDLGACGLSVPSGATVSKLSSGESVSIMWGESVTRPRPIEVWIERPAKGGA